MYWFYLDNPKRLSVWFDIDPSLYHYPATLRDALALRAEECLKRLHDEAERSSPEWHARVLIFEPWIVTRNDQGVERHTRCATVFERVDAETVVHPQSMKHTTGFHRVRKVMSTEGRTGKGMVVNKTLYIVEDA